MLASRLHKRMSSNIHKSIHKYTHKCRLKDKYSSVLNQLSWQVPFHTHTHALHIVCNIDKVPFMYNYGIFKCWHPSFSDLKKPAMDRILMTYLLKIHSPQWYFTSGNNCHSTSISVQASLTSVLYQLQFLKNFSSTSISVFKIISVLISVLVWK